MRAPGSLKNHAPNMAAGIKIIPAILGVTTASIESRSTGSANVSTGMKLAALSDPSVRCINANQTQNPPQKTVSTDAPQLMTWCGMVMRGVFMALVGLGLIGELFHASRRGPTSNPQVLTPTQGHGDPNMTRTKLTTRHRIIAAAVSLFAAIPVANAHPFSMSMSEKDSGWQVVVDGVMGGLSSGVIEETPDGMLFRGSLRLENNGGFSQIRTPIEMGSLEGADGLEIEVRGDGRTYIFDARVANIRMMAASYQATFDTSDNEWTTIRLPFKDFSFHTFGRRVPSVGEIDPKLIESLGVTLADKQPGTFDLEIRAVRGYSTRSKYNNRLAALGRELESRAKASAVVTNDINDGDLDERDRRIAKLGALLAGQSGTLMRASTETTMVDVSFADRVIELCALAIDRGVPLFNNDQPAACATVYEVALASVLVLGQDDLTDSMRELVTDALRDGQRMHDQRDRAWHYRRAIDALMRSYATRA